MVKGGAVALPAAFGARLRHASWSHRPLFAANQAGFVNKLNDGLAWGLFPLYFAATGLSLREIGWIAALYPAVWSIAQIGTGALSDRVGRRPLIVAGMLLQAIALVAFAATTGIVWWIAAAVVLGIGTAAVYPTLIAQVSDLITPRDRASGIGRYRLWRGLGYVAGGLMAGILADLLGFRAAIGSVASLRRRRDCSLASIFPREVERRSSSAEPHQAPSPELQTYRSLPDPPVGQSEPLDFGFNAHVSPLILRRCSI